MHFSIKLRKILLSNGLYFSLLFLALLFIGVSHIQKEKIPSLKKTTLYKGTITSKVETDTAFLLETNGKISFELYLPKENLKENLEKELIVGSKISFIGEGSRIKNKFYNFYSTSYENYFARKKIFYKMTPTELKILKQDNPVENIRKGLYSYIESFSKTKAYLKTFLLGDQGELSFSMKEAYQEIGVSHLFALSGMHISFLIEGFYTLLKKRIKKENLCFVGVCFFLLIYLLLVKRSPSILRASLFFLFFEGNKRFNFYIKSYQLLIGILSILLFIDPFLFEDVGFLYSFSIASMLILFQKYLWKGTFLKKLFGVSFFSFFLSLPITIANQYQINFASLFFNLLLVPFVSMIVFPLSFLVVLFPFLESFFSVCIFLLETVSRWGATLPWFKFCFLKVSSIYYVFLFVLFLLSFFKKPLFFLYGLCLFLHAFLLPSLQEDRLTMLDVGQGDSFLFESDGQALLLDVGGKEGISNDKQNASFLMKELKARGISSLQIVLSHGDQDHAGNTAFFMQKMNVTSIKTNLGSLTETEKEIQKEAHQRNIPFEKVKEGFSFSVGNFHFEQLNTVFQNENDSSSIYFVTNKNNRMLFLGDASCKTEKVLLQNYQIPNLTLLKVGHHGSKTSTCEALLTRRIGLALISSGRDNQFHHPNPMILNRLAKEKIPYINTKEKGSVEISFPNLTVKTVLP